MQAPLPQGCYEAAWAEQLIVCICLEEEEDICLVAQRAIAGAAQFLADVLGFSLFPRVDAGAHFSFASLAEEIRMFTDVCVCVCA